MKVKAILLGSLLTLLAAGPAGRFSLDKEKRAQLAVLCALWPTGFDVKSLANP